MSRIPLPFHRKPRRLCFVQIGGKQIILGQDKSLTFKQYHQLMADVGQAPWPAPKIVGAPTVVATSGQFLDWLPCRVNEGTKAQRSFNWCHGYLQSFGAFMDGP